MRGAIRHAVDRARLLLLAVGLLCCFVPTARALAFVRGRNYALPQDVLDMARDVMRHRLVLSFEALSDNVTADDVLTTVLKKVPVPVVPLREHSNVRAGS